jgi:hypothetical protein
MNADETAVMDLIIGMISRRARLIPWPPMRAKDKNLFQFFIALMIFDICVRLNVPPGEHKELYDNNYWKN